MANCNSCCLLLQLLWTALLSWQLPPVSGYLNIFISHHEVMKLMGKSIHMSPIFGGSAISFRFENNRRNQLRAPPH